MHEFVCRDLTICPRGHLLYHGGPVVLSLLLPEEANTQNFMQRFGGKKLDPTQRGRGIRWARRKENR